MHSTHDGLGTGSATVVVVVGGGGGGGGGAESEATDAVGCEASATHRKRCILLIAGGLGTGRRRLCTSITAN